MTAKEFLTEEGFTEKQIQALGSAMELMQQYGNQIANMQRENDDRFYRSQFGKKLGRLEVDDVLKHKASTLISTIKGKIKSAIKRFVGNKVTYDDFGQSIFGKDNQMIADVRGWGAIQHLFDKEEDAMRFQKKLGQFVADAINDKLNTLENDR